MYRYLILTSTPALGVGGQFHSAYRTKEEAESKISKIRNEIGTHNSFNGRLELIDMKTSMSLKKEWGVCPCSSCNRT